MTLRIGSAAASAVAVVFALSGGFAWAGAGEAGHGHEAMEAKAGEQTIEQMREVHKAHEHGHDFEAMEHMSQAELARMMAFITDVGIALPPMNSERGRTIFLEKGCIACHAVNGVGGDVGPALNAAEMPVPMNAFEFTARMWRGANAMIAMQEDEQFGGQIELSGQDIADLVAFAHDEKEQAELAADQIPEKYRAMIE
jgi:mono/diheme cytochrome c family protein